MFLPTNAGQSLPCRHFGYVVCGGDGGGYGDDKKYIPLIRPNEIMHMIYDLRFLIELILPGN